MGVMNFFDSLSARTAWAGYDARAKRIKPNWTQEQRDRWVNLKSRRAIRETQNGGSPLDMAMDATAARGTAASVFTLFTTDAFKTRNRITRAYRRSKSFGTQVLASELVAWYVGFKVGQLAWTGVSAAIAAALGWDDEDAERLARKVLSPSDDAWKAAQMLGGTLSPVLGNELVDLVQAIVDKSKRSGRGELTVPAMDSVNAPIKSALNAVSKTERWLRDEGSARAAMLAWSRVMGEATAVAPGNPFLPLMRRIIREMELASDD